MAPEGHRALGMADRGGTSRQREEQQQLRNKFFDTQKKQTSKTKLTKGGMIPLYAGNPGPTGGWGKGKAGLPAGGFLGGM